MTSPEIHCDQYLAHPPAVVWKALTDPELHARWWVPGDIKPIVGHRFTLDMGVWGAQPGEVTAVQNPAGVFHDLVNFVGHAPTKFSRSWKTSARSRFTGKVYRDRGMVGR